VAYVKMWAAKSLRRCQRLRCSSDIRRQPAASHWLQPQHQPTAD